MVVLLDHPGGSDQIGISDGIDDLGDGKAITIQLAGIDENVIFRRPPSDIAGFGDARQAIEARGNIVVGKIPQFGRAPRGRRNAEPDHGKDGKGQAIDVEARGGWQGRQGLRDAPLHQMKRIVDVYIPAKEHADLARTACRDGAHIRDARNQAHGLLDGARHGKHLHIDRSNPVVHQNDDAGKNRLRENRNRNLEHKHDAGKSKADDDEDQSPAVAFNEFSET